MNRRHLLSALILLASSSPALALDFGFEGFADLRAILPSDRKSAMQGGLGKLRYGDPSQDARADLGQIVGQAHVLITGELMAMVVGEIQPKQRTLVDVTEAFLRYRPISLSAWRFTFKAGAFFPPISLENTDIGWMSPWTITPSAINTWVGEELRTIGGEGSVEWRSEARTLGLTAAVYAWNDPAGILLAGRGWAMSDWITGLAGKPRLPDAYARSRRLVPPQRTWEFLEIDRRPGWYAGASWDENGLGHVEVLRYDNEADPKKTRIQVAWHTDFWSAGLGTNIGALTLLAQAMTGETYIQPSANFHSNTDFDAAYLLAGWDMGDWRLAGRFDVFSTEEERPGTSVRLSEHGNAITAAANWLPYDWLRLTAEWVRVDSTRNQRKSDSLPPKAVENQFQLSAKFYY